MPVEITEDWLDILDTTNYAPLKDPDNTYQSYRFKNLDINSVTTKNFRKKLCPSLIEQVEIFIPPSGSFSNADLRRYLELISGYETSTTDVVLGLSLADQIRITFSDMKTSTICDRYPEIKSKYLLKSAFEKLPDGGINISTCSIKEGHNFFLKFFVVTEEMSKFLNR